ncbi:hypothetical protein V6N11_069357 [Hibiscus sabdariffa]|uniref:Secreted protein n=1 Tax=Hibiscus sabdariffa TaxID=183260 RepID=A0ABR1ZHX2_9ROSI
MVLPVPPILSGSVGIYTLGLVATFGVAGCERARGTFPEFLIVEVHKWVQTSSFGQNDYTREVNQISGNTTVLFANVILIRANVVSSRVNVVKRTKWAYASLNV